MVSEIENRPLPANIIYANGTAIETTAAWFTVREIGGPNTAVFSSTNLADESILGISDAEDVRRGASAIITYDSDDTDVNVKHSEATIEIQSPDDVWTSGLAIPIVIVDGDVNKNSRDSNDVDLTDPDSIIPTLVTGVPFTLSKLSGDTWIGWNIAGEQNATAITLLNRDPSDDLSTYTLTTGPFILKGFNPDPDNPGEYQNTVNKTNAAVLKNSATTASADRAVLQFYPQFVNVEDDPETDVNEAHTNLTDLVGVTGDTVDTNGGPYANIDFLVIDLDGGVKALKDTLIEHGSSKKGHNFINYNVESLHEDIDVESIQVLVGGDVVDTISDLDGPKRLQTCFYRYNSVVCSSR